MDNIKFIVEYYFEINFTENNYNNLCLEITKVIKHKDIYVLETQENYYLCKNS